MTPKSAVYRIYFIFSVQVLVVNHIGNYRDTTDCYALFFKWNFQFDKFKSSGSVM